MMVDIIIINIVKPNLFKLLKRFAVLMRIKDSISNYSPKKAIKLQINLFYNLQYQCNVFKCQLQTLKSFLRNILTKYSISNYFIINPLHIK